MTDHFYFTRRWLSYFALYFLIWYPISFILVTAYQATGSAVVYIGANVFTPLWALCISYLYFRRAQNTWSARFITAFGWMFLMFVLAGALVKPVYGLDWRNIINWNVINANWINVVAIIVGALAAVKPKTGV
jgi:hypothetical protein